jgi:hypothetical protein
MSETPRLYTSPGGRPISLSRRGRRRRIGRVLLIALAIFFVWAFWISRDTHPVAEFVPAERSIEAVLPHAAVARYRVAASRVWDGVPQEIVASAPQAIAGNRGLPDWIVGNLIGGTAVVVANDTTTWSDAVFIARMTRAGCVIERALRWRPANDREWAGGLRLRYWEPGKLHYAVRGRTLVASPSRDALVAAITLTPERRVPAEAVKAALSDTGSEDARGTWTVPANTELGRVVHEIRFAVRVDENEAVVKLRASFRPEVSDALSPHLANAKPKTLPPAIEGPFAISADLGMNIEDTWRAMSEVVDVSWLSPEQWQAWRREADGKSAAALLTGLLGPMGPAMRVTWQGVDLDEMSPTPILVGSIAGTRDMAAAFLERLPSPKEAARVAEARVTFDAEMGRVEAPLMSGPAMAPLGEWSGDTFYFSTSSAAAPDFFTSGRKHTRAIGKPANLYARMDPAACMQILVRAGRELAQSGVLRGQTPESFEEDAAAWTERAAALDYIEGTAIVTHTHIEADLRVKCRPRG